MAMTPRERMRKELSSGGRPPDFEITNLPIKVLRLAHALKEWQQKGFKIADKASRRTRFEQCKSCGYWHAEGNFYLGECHAAGCGCTRMKIWLATSACPKGNWPAQL